MDDHSGLFRRFFNFSFEFPEGDTSAPLEANLAPYAFVALHASAALDGAVVEFSSLGPWGSNVVLTLTLTAGFNLLEDDDIKALVSCGRLVAELQAAAPANATIWLSCKS